MACVNVLTSTTVIVDPVGKLLGLRGELCAGNLDLPPDGTTTRLTRRRKQQEKAKWLRQIMQNMQVVFIVLCVWLSVPLLRNGNQAAERNMRVGMCIKASMIDATIDYELSDVLIHLRQ